MIESGFLTTTRSFSINLDAVVETPLMPATVAAVRSDVTRGRLYVALAALAWSTAGVVQRELTTDPTTQIAGRAFFGFVGLLAFVAVVERGHLVRAFRAIGPAGIGYAVSLAIASGGFVLALNLTSVANVLFIQAAAPIVAALLGRIFLGEHPSRRTWLAMLVALGGVGLLVGGPGIGLSAGILVAIVVMLAFAVGIVLVRRHSEVSMAPATCLSQVMVSNMGGLGGHDVALLAVLGIGQMGLGILFITLGARLIPAAQVALIMLLETVLGPMWVWIVRSETPPTITLVGGFIVLAAVMYQTLSGSRADTRLVAPTSPERSDGLGRGPAGPVSSISNREG
jgi:drug/metabolite transporter (DMT)-like permease